MLALGLLEDPQSKRAIGLPRRVEALHRFLLSQLDKEAKEPTLPPVPAQAAPTPTSPTSKVHACMRACGDFLPVLGGRLKRSHSLVPNLVLQYRGNSQRFGRKRESG